jgi:type I restriction enzyme M protein
MKAALDKAGITNQDDALRAAAGQAFYNTSPFLLHDLKARATHQKRKDDFEAYLDGFSPNVQDILTNFEFRHPIPRLSKADALGTLIEKLLDKDINISPFPVGEGEEHALSGLLALVGDVVAKYEREHYAIEPSAPSPRHRGIPCAF